jgi:DNA-binding transcriptional ArsR family regulator
MDAALRALADGTRRHILALVWREERTASDIASAFAMSRPAVSQHLKVLVDSDLLALRREGTRRFYRANRSGVAKLQAELAALWDDGLGRLKRAAERAERAARAKPPARGRAGRSRR